MKKKSAKVKRAPGSKPAKKRKAYERSESHIRICTIIISALARTKPKALRRRRVRCTSGTRVKDAGAEPQRFRTGRVMAQSRRSTVQNRQPVRNLWGGKFSNCLPSAKLPSTCKVVGEPRN